MSDNYLERSQVYKVFLKFLITNQKIDTYNIPELNHWLSVNDLTVEQEYYLLKILSKAQYYTEDQIIYGYKYLIEEYLIPYIICNLTSLDYPKNFINNPLSYCDFNFREILENILFIPLSSEEKPDESGNHISRILTKNQIISNHQLAFIKNAIKSKAWEKYKYIVIIDDGIGTGQQIKDFLKTDEMKLLMSKLESPKLLINTTLLAHEKGLNHVDKNIFSIFLDKYDISHRVFSINSIYWERGERDKAQKCLGDLAKDRGLKLRGRDNLGCSIFISKTIPNWTLPLFWMKTPNWEPLVHRGNSQ